MEPTFRADTGVIAIVGSESEKQKDRCRSGGECAETVGRPHATTTFIRQLAFGADHHPLQENLARKSVDRTAELAQPRAARLAAIEVLRHRNQLRLSRL